MQRVVMGLLLFFELFCAALLAVNAVSGDIGSTYAAAAGALAMIPAVAAGIAIPDRWLSRTLMGMALFFELSLSSLFAFAVIGGGLPANAGFFVMFFGATGVVSAGAAVLLPGKLMGQLQMGLVAAAASPAVAVAIGGVAIVVAGVVIILSQRHLRELTFADEPEEEAAVAPVANRH